jgi:methionyl-tRNA formyltransferase
MAGLKVIFAGSGEFGIPALQSLIQTGYEIVQVVSQPDRAGGRGRRMTPTPISQLAARHGLPLLRTQDINAERPADADVMVVVAFGQKIAEHIVDAPRLGSINLHASRLPAYRGAAPINWAILDGQSITGNSVIRLAPRMDAGAILAQSQVSIGELETAGELHDRLAVDGAALVQCVLKSLSEGTSAEVAQDESRATAAPKLSRHAAQLDFTQSAEQLARRIRGLYPWPGCRVRLLDAAANERSRLTLVTARTGPGEGSRWHPGEVTVSGGVDAGGGTALDLVRVQPDGGRAMSLAEYRNGHEWQPGLRLESIV